MAYSEFEWLLGERTLQMAVKEVMLVNIFSCKKAPIAHSEVVVKACSLIKHFGNAIASLN